MVLILSEMKHKPPKISLKVSQALEDEIWAAPLTPQVWGEPLKSPRLGGFSDYLVCQPLVPERANGATSESVGCCQSS